MGSRRKKNSHYRNRKSDSRKRSYKRDRDDDDDDDDKRYRERRDHRREDRDERDSDRKEQEKSAEPSLPLDDAIGSTAVFGIMGLVGLAIATWGIRAPVDATPLVQALTEIAVPLAVVVATSLGIKRAWDLVPKSDQNQIADLQKELESVQTKLKLSQAPADEQIVCKDSEIERLNQELMDTKERLATAETVQTFEDRLAEKEARLRLQLEDTFEVPKLGGTTDSPAGGEETLRA